MATIHMLERLPNLDDDDDLGQIKDHVVVVDGEKDLQFKGKLLASAAPESRGQDRWREYRVYQTIAGNYVLSKIGRSIREDERDKFEALVWKPPENRRSGDQYMPYDNFPDALTEYFKYDALAKQLYAKLNIDATREIE